MLVLKIIVLVLSYLLGSLSPAILLCRSKYGVDIRTLGSGNAGTTNVLRNYGKKMAAMTLLLDALKGVPCYFAGFLLFDSYGMGLACGLAAIIGHIFPVYYNFKGGKGVATTLGVAIAAAPLAALITVVFVILVLAVCKRISLGSLLGVLFFTGAAALLDYDTVLVYWGIALTVLIWAKHRENIKRLLQGKEPKFSLKNHGGK